MTKLDEKRVDWLYAHFQAISAAGHRYLVLYAVVCAFSLIVFLSSAATFQVPIISLSVHRDLLIGGAIALGSFLFVGYAGSYDKGEATLLRLCEALDCQYQDLEFIDTHPTVLDFAQFRREADAARRNLFARATVALLYPICLLAGLGLLGYLWIEQLRGGTLIGVGLAIEFVALVVLLVAIDRAVPFIGRRWRTFLNAERARGKSRKGQPRGDGT